jgi:hypothetical protein
LGMVEAAEVLKDRADFRNEISAKTLKAEEDINRILNELIGGLGGDDCAGFVIRTKHDENYNKEKGGRLQLLLIVSENVRESLRQKVG